MGEAAKYYNSASAASGNNTTSYQTGPSGSTSQDGPVGERGVLGAVAGGIAGAVGGKVVGDKTGHRKTAAILGAIGGAIAGHKIQDGVSDWKDEKEKKKREEEEEKRREEEEREKKKREEEEKKRREEAKHHQQGGVRPEPSHGNSNFRGNFSGSCNNIRLEAHGDFVLRASCRRTDGSYQESCISLNKYLENSNGCFRWTDGSSGGHCHAPQTVTVQPGDTLRDIAARFGTTYQEIAQLNGIPNPDLIHPGQVFRIPQKGGHGGGGNFAASARNVRLVDNGRRLEAELLRNGCWVTASIALDERIGNDNGCLRFV